MGKKTSTKGKEKKWKRIQENETRKKGQDLVRRANAFHGNLMEEETMDGTFARFSYEDHTIHVESYDARNLGQDRLEWAFQICKTNMKQLYENVWGWDDAKKKEELNHENARFLLACPDHRMEPIGYAHIRFEMEDSRHVLYVYELQVCADAQGKGIGKLLMAAVETIAKKMDMAWILLTVLKENTGAVNFYYKLGYRLDDSSPGAVDPMGQYGYEILSKPCKSFGCVNEVANG